MPQFSASVLSEPAKMLLPPGPSKTRLRWTTQHEFNLKLKVGVQAVEDPSLKVVMLSSCTSTPPALSIVKASLLASPSTRSCAGGRCQRNTEGPLDGCCTRVRCPGKRRPPC